jgi:hypothetical protein
MKNKKYYSVWTIPESNIKCDTLTHKYMTSHFPGLVQPILLTWRTDTFDLLRLVLRCIVDESIQKLHVFVSWEENYIHVVRERIPVVFTLEFWVTVRDSTGNNKVCIRNRNKFESQFVLFINRLGVILIGLFTAAYYRIDNLLHINIMLVTFYSIWPGADPGRVASGARPPQIGKK